MIVIGSQVRKKSGKKFANGKMVATVIGFKNVTFPCSHSRYAKQKGEKTELAAVLDGVARPLRLAVLKKDICNG